MAMATPQWAKGIWQDPVGSKVIAAGIILVIGSIAGWLSFHYRNGLLTRSVPLWSLLLATLLLIGLAPSLAFTLRRLREPGPRAERACLEPITADPIKITHPRPREVLTDGRPLGGGYSFPVRGVLKRLPRDHAIWILVQDDVIARVWPQGFRAVEFDPEQGTWEGWVNGMGGPVIRIVAVVAPPTSQDLFRFFQKAGASHNHHYEPLERIPPECINRDSVQARVPKQ